MVVYQRTSALNFVENYRKYNKYITNGPTAVKEKTSVWGGKSFFMSKASYSSNNLEKSYSYFYVLLLRKEKGKKSFFVLEGVCMISDIISITG